MPRSSKIGKSTDLNRRTAVRKRNERSSFLILCEGETEKNYFTGMRSRNGPQLDVNTPGRDHVAIIEAAIERSQEAKRSGSAYEQVWCVVDTELDFQLVERIQMKMIGSGVEVALSCPSFEAWLILHIMDCRRPFQSASEAKKRLQELRPKWSESATRFVDFVDGLQDAEHRAHTIDPSGRSHMTNPSSTVWRLTRKIRDATP
ncbi:RloB family protein [Nocardia sp. NPDC058658]|uniref:RloB family protein n=1 Tax=Nocardia sp. NPDC058658 TaxID=3346580 RepID=UPI003655FB4E